MEVYNKFIIETDDQLGDCMIIAKCTFHKQLVVDKTKVKGGGWWARNKNTITLFGDSHDFGAAKIEDIAKCVQNRRCYTNNSLMNKISSDFKFFYRDVTGEVTDLETYEIIT